VGIGLTLATSTWMESLVAQSSSRDPVLLTIVPLLLFAAALGAIWIPARRAVAIDPLASLRNE
jgi:putative ABC transport system permease protein